MKIMAIIPSLSRGGAERVLSLLTRKWAVSHTVIVVAFEGSRPAYDWGGTLVDLQLGTSKTTIGKIRLVLGSIRGLTRLFWAEKPEMVVSFMEPANYPAAICAALTGKTRRLMVSVQHDPAKLTLVRRLLLPCVYRFPFRVVAPSYGVQNALQSRGVPQAKLLTIPNPVVIPTKPDDQRLPFPHRYVLGAGRLRPEKGFDRLLNAFFFVKRDDLHLVILGEGIERGRLAEMARKARP